ncbi:DEAD/DEAH box helicase [Leucothrix sargassi]|nr:DEAD/DEAH box helicase [Leucothrix sargassi]
MPNTPAPHAFARFELERPLLEAITEQGYQRPMPIQGRAIPKILEGRDVLASAETGSGKTAAYVLPLLQSLIMQRYEEGAQGAKGHHIRALILVPTRELALQVSEVVTELGSKMRPAVRCVSVYGGVELTHQQAVLNRGVEVLVATPARLLSLVDAKAVVFNKLRTLVLDEVDRLISQDFQDEVETILRHLPNKRQNLFFTATFPDSIRDLVRKVLNNPEVIDVPLGEKILIDQHVAIVNLRDKVPALNYLLQENDWEQVLVFATTKKSCDQLTAALQSLGVDVLALHGSIPTDQREEALARFKRGKLRVLVATDIAARGIDIGQLDCVINYELPRQANDYQHRIGRTGRAGKTGQAINLVAHHELAHYEAIEKYTRERLPRETIPGFEPDEVAPPAPSRKKPKKVVGKKRRVKLKESQKKRRDKKTFGSNINKDDSDSSSQSKEPKPSYYKQTPDSEF